MDPDGDGAPGDQRPAIAMTRDAIPPSVQQTTGVTPSTVPSNLRDPFGRVPVLGGVIHGVPDDLYEEAHDLAVALAEPSKLRRMICDQLIDQALEFAVVHGLKT